MVKVTITRTADGSRWRVGEERINGIARVDTYDTRYEAVHEAARRLDYPILERPALLAASMLDGHVVNEITVEWLRQAVQRVIAGLPAATGRTGRGPGDDPVGRVLDGAAEAMLKRVVREAIAEDHRARHPEAYPMSRESMRFMGPLDDTRDLKPPSDADLAAGRDTHYLGIDLGKPGGDESVLVRRDDDGLVSRVTLPVGGTSVFDKPLAARCATCENTPSATCTHKGCPWVGEAPWPEPHIGRVTVAEEAPSAESAEPDEAARTEAERECGAARDRLLWLTYGVELRRLLAKGTAGAELISCNLVSGGSRAEATVRAFDRLLSATHTSPIVLDHVPVEKLARQRAVDVLRAIANKHFTLFREPSRFAFGGIISTPPEFVFGSSPAACQEAIAPPPARRQRPEPIDHTIASFTRPSRTRPPTP